MDFPEENATIFSEVSNDVIGFVSTWKSEKTSNLVSTEISTDPLPAKKDMAIGTNEKKNVSTQTELNLVSNIQVDETKLAEWLKRIYPQVAEELNAGVTQVFDSSDDLEKNHNISKYQTICVGTDEETNEYLINGTSAWLSVSTQNAPTLAISCFPSHPSLCDHSNAFVILFGPKRQSLNAVNYTEITRIPVKSCITSLVTNSYNKDMFAGGSISGDLYIWQYIGTTLTELFCESVQQGAIIGMAWIKITSFSNDYGLLTCHQDGFVILWKVGKQILREKIFKITSRSKHDNKLSLSTITAMSGSEFVVGTEDGNLLLCSASQLLPIRGIKNVFDPVIQELESHKFRITSLCRVAQKSKSLLVSCDISGEVYIHDTDNIMKQEASATIKMPLPFKNQIICNNELEFILSPGKNGELEMLRVDNGVCSLIEGSLTGLGNLIQISENGSWIVTGTYQGTFQIFKVE